MGNSRKRYNDDKHTKTQQLISLKSQKGVALFQAILISLIVLLSIGGLYSFITRTFKVTTEYKSFITVREAAVAGVNFATSISSLESYLLPESPLNSSGCVKFNIDFRIYSRDELGANEITVCRLNLGHQPGSGATGASYEPVGGALSSVKIALKITSIARFPAINPQQESRVEAVYYR